MAACPAKQELTGSRLWRIQSDKIKVYPFRYPETPAKDFFSNDEAEKWLKEFLD